MDGKGRNIKEARGGLFVLGRGFVGVLSVRMDTWRRQDQWAHLEDPTLSQRQAGQIMRTVSEMSKMGA